MNAVKSIRHLSGLSQRRVAEKSGLAFRTVQLLESGRHDAQVSTLKKFGAALGFSQRGLERHIASYFAISPDAVHAVAEKMADHPNDWAIPFFDFVDSFRRGHDAALISLSPSESVPHKFRALLASSTELLCRESGVLIPPWTAGICPLNEPWFPSESESLKATALLESPLAFRSREIFVLGNFLERA